MDHSHEHKPDAARPDDAKSIFTVSNVLTGLAIGGLVIGAGIILAPHILPALGIGAEDLAEEAALGLHHGPSGIAGAVNGLLGVVPLIGTQLAQGGMFTAVATGATTIGGMLLSHFLEKKEDGTEKIRWSRVIKYGALATSALMALPTVLTALGTGIIYLSLLASGAAAGTAAAGMVSSSIGSIGGTHQGIMMGASGLAAALPHLLLCCASMLPAVFGFKSLHADKAKDALSDEDEKLVKKFGPDDPNVRATAGEKSWVQAYNKAPNEVKPGMQSFIRSLGYTPDFHADGTVHLFQHKHSPGR